MLPGSRIREELRREAAQVHVPGDMWRKVSAGLAQERRRAWRRRRCRGWLQMLKPVLGAALLAGTVGLLFCAAPGDAPGGSDSDVAGGGAPANTVAFLRPPKDNLRAGYYFGAAQREAEQPHAQSPGIRDFLITQ